MLPRIPAAKPSRRRFLQTTAAAAAAIHAPLILRGRPASTEKNGNVRVALVGCGDRGRLDIGNSLGSAIEIVALCDVDETTFYDTRHELKRRVTDDKSVKDLDAIAIAGRAV